MLTDKYRRRQRPYHTPSFQHIDACSPHGHMADFGNQTLFPREDWRNFKIFNEATRDYVLSIVSNFPVSPHQVMKYNAQQLRALTHPGVLAVAQSLQQLGDRNTLKRLRRHVTRTDTISTHMRFLLTQPAIQEGLIRGYLTFSELSMLADFKRKDGEVLAKALNQPFFTKRRFREQVGLPIQKGYQPPEPERRQPVHSLLPTVNRDVTDRHIAYPRHSVGLWSGDEQAMRFLSKTAQQRVNELVCAYRIPYARAIAIVRDGQDIDGMNVLANRERLFHTVWRELIQDGAVLFDEVLQCGFITTRRMPWLSEPGIRYLLTHRVWDLEELLQQRLTREQIDAINEYAEVVVAGFCDIEDVLVFKQTFLPTHHSCKGVQRMNPSNAELLERLRAAQDEFRQAVGDHLTTHTGDQQHCPCPHIPGPREGASDNPCDENFDFDHGLDTRAETAGKGGRVVTEMKSDAHGKVVRQMHETAAGDTRVDTVRVNKGGCAHEVEHGVNREGGQYMHFMKGNHSGCNGGEIAITQSHEDCVTTVSVRHGPRV